MKAIVLHAPNDLGMEERPIPRPGAGEVLVRVCSSAICHTDLVSIGGGQPGIAYPKVIGHEFSGIVEAVGPGVTRRGAGDRVCGLGYAFCGRCSRCRIECNAGCRNLLWIPGNMDGADQEYMVAPDLMLYAIADSLDMDRAALVEPAANGCAAVDAARVGVGDNVAVVGPGPIGLLAMQFASLRSPRSLIVLGTRAERLALATRLGATHTVNVRETDPVEAVMDITGGDGADAVLYCASGEESWRLAGQLVGFGGRLAIESTPPASDAEWPVQPYRFNAKAMSYIGVNGYSGAQFEKALRLVEAGKVNVEALVSHRFALDDYRAAFATSEKRAGGAMKVMFEIHGESHADARDLC